MGRGHEFSVSEGIGGLLATHIRLDERLLGYNYRFTRNDPLHRVVHSIVIYLRPVSQPPQPPLVRIFITGRETIRFDYDSIELAEVEAETLLNLGLPGLLPLLPLTKGGVAHERRYSR